MTYSFSTVQRADHIVLVASELRQKYTAWLEKWPGGWVAQATSDTGTGILIAEGLPCKEDAVDVLIDWIGENGGTALIDHSAAGEGGERVI